ncbi:UPF0175 family protein [Candidatus Woesearchaeota archaeon]|nr:UPF0175 family protein [Candidatus Woesearchaeota archaeon]
MESVITTRFPKDMDKDLSIVAKTEDLDKSTTIRRLLAEALIQWKKDYAIKMYKEGKFSTGQAAKFANVSIWEFFDLLKERKIPLNYDMEELERDLRSMKWKQ